LSAAVVGGYVILVAVLDQAVSARLGRFAAVTVLVALAVAPALPPLQRLVDRAMYGDRRVARRPPSPVWRRATRGYCQRIREPCVAHRRPLSALHLGGRVERGEVWWALIDERCAVVLLSGEEASEFRAMQVVAPATTDEKRGFVVLSGDEVSDPRAMQQVVAPVGSGVGGVGVEVEIGTHEGLPHEGVVRVALPRDGHVFCTWLVTLTRDDLIERAGALSSVKLGQLEDALRLAGLE
jgi:mRNA interferase MazF